MISMKRMSGNRISCFQMAVSLSVGLLILITISGSLAFSPPVPRQHQQRQPQQLTSGNSITSYNNLDNLISDILKDADYRLKKSKGNTLRQVKQTLRFGRSNPWYPVSSQEEQLALSTMDESDNDQSRFLKFGRRRR